MIINPYKISNNVNEVEQGDKIKSMSIEQLYNIIINEFKDDILSLDRRIVSKNIEEYIIKNQFNIGSKYDKAVQMLMDKIYGYGMLEKYIIDKITTDIRVVSPRDIYIKQKGKWKKAPEAFNGEKELEEYVRFCALKNNSIVNFENPICIFSDKQNHLRIEAGIVPANVKYASIVIRLHKSEEPKTLQQLTSESNMLDLKSLRIIKSMIKNNNNIILCGKGGSGKTTLMKAIINEIPPNISITSNEETAELYLTGRNVIQRECILRKKSRQKH